MYAAYFNCEFFSLYELLPFIWLLQEEVMNPMLTTPTGEESTRVLRKDRHSTSLLLNCWRVSISGEMYCKSQSEFNFLNNLTLCYFFLVL